MHDDLHSALYTGWIRHRRSMPVGNRFRYRLFMLYLDMDELDQVFAGRWLWSTRRPALARFRRADYLGDPNVPLKQAVADRVEQEIGRRPQGPIRLLTHLRYFGYGFNPVSFYFCYDRNDENIEAIVAEITNTPWGEKHRYVLNCRSGSNGRHEFAFDKTFHVSPFMPMSVHYRWRFIMRGDQCIVHMENHSRNGHFFDATLTLRREPITGPALARVLVQYPFMTLKVIGGIHWQALKLWLKRCPVYTHPDKLARQRETQP